MLLYVCGRLMYSSGLDHHRAQFKLNITINERKSFPVIYRLSSFNLSAIDNPSITLTDRNIAHLTLQSPSLQ